MYLYFGFQLRTIEKNWVQWKHPQPEIPRHEIFLVYSKLVFRIFHHDKITLSKKQLYILIELEILYHPVCLSISLHSFIEK